MSVDLFGISVSMNLSIQLGCAGMPVDVSADRSQPKDNFASYVPEPRSAQTALLRDAVSRSWKNLRVSDG